MFPNLGFYLATKKEEEKPTQTNKQANKQHSLLLAAWIQYLHTGWPRKNATILIVNFKDIINKTELVFILLCGKFIFQQNDTMIIKFG